MMDLRCVTVLCVGVLVSGCSNWLNASSIQNLSVPTRYVIAYVDDSPPFQPFVRFSDDGIGWSAQVGIEDRFGAATSAEHIPAGIGSSDEGYLAAWWDNGGLHTALSDNAESWAFPAFHGNFTVFADPSRIGSLSTPSVEYNFSSDAWLIAFAENDGSIHVVNANGPGIDGIVIPNVTTRWPPRLVWVGNDTLHLLFVDDRFVLRYLSSNDGVNWSSAPGMPVLLNGAQVRPGRFSAVRSVGNVRVAVTGVGGGGDLNFAGIRVYDYRDGSLQELQRLASSYVDSLGPVAVGPIREVSVLDAGSRGAALWHEGTQVVSFSTPRVVAIDAAFGPDASRTLPPLRCGRCDIRYGPPDAPTYKQLCVPEDGTLAEYECTP